MVVAGVRIDFFDAQGKEGEWEGLKGVFGLRFVGDFRKEGVLRAGFLVFLGL